MNHPSIHPFTDPLESLHYADEDFRISLSPGPISFTYTLSKQDLEERAQGASIELSDLDLENP